MSKALITEARQLRDWLLEAAFPLWWRVGADHALGGYHERIDFDGRPAILPLTQIAMASESAMVSGMTLAA